MQKYGYGQNTVLILYDNATKIFKREYYKYNVLKVIPGQLL